jgi:DUF1009 family protein
MNQDSDSLGMIAGSRSLPLLLARLARQGGVRRLVAVAFEGETDPALANLVDEIVWVKVGQLGKLIQAFTKRQIRQCVMAGQVHPKNLFDLRPDLRALSVLLRLPERNARTIFGAIADELHKDGVELVDARPWLTPVMPGPGYQVGPKLTPAQVQDVAFGFRLAKEVSRLDIGQLAVVEGFEGTDACLRRGGELAGRDGGAIAVKVASETHDFRFDIPCLGRQTLEICASVRIAALAFDAGKTLLLDREQVEQDAVRRRVTLLAVS